MIADRYFPITCVDNFLENPDSLRKYALSLEYSQQPGNYPGYRSECLHKLDVNLYFLLCAKILSLFYPLKSKPSFSAKMQFQKIIPYNVPEKLNTGWIHKDSGTFLAGVIYLNKNPIPSSGTTIFRPLVDEIKYDNFNQTRNKLYADENIDVNFCLSEKEKYESQFEATLEVKNLYNRMICYPGNYYHTASGFYAKDEPRLSLAFFFHELSKYNTDKDLPILRSNFFKI
jgi:hypothetical protein